MNANAVIIGPRVQNGQVADAFCSWSKHNTSFWGQVTHDATNCFVDVLAFVLKTFLVGRSNRRMPTSIATSGFVLVPCSRITELFRVRSARLLGQRDAGPITARDELTLDDQSKVPPERQRGNHARETLTHKHLMCTLHSPLQSRTQPNS